MKDKEIGHPSKDLEVRQNGFGIAAGLEKPYMIGHLGTENSKREQYCSVPHSGYYGVGLGIRPFKKGQASYTNEISWYKTQYEEQEK